MPAPKHSTRSAALDVLMAWADGHAYADSLIEQKAKRYSLSKDDRNLLSAIVLSILRNQSLLDHWIKQFRDDPLDLETRNLLRIGFTQILLLKIPDHAAVNETVNCARKSTRGLVNAVMRRTTEQKDRLLSETSKLPLSTRFSHPKNLVDHWTKLFGEKATSELLEWNNTPADAFIRLNPLHPDFEEEKPPPVLNGLILHPVKEAPNFFHVEGTVPPEWYENGLIYGQDPSTRHSPSMINAQPHERILDACAAPGGKAGIMAAAMENQGELVVSDVNEKRIPRLRSNLSRLKVKNVTFLTHDWTQAPNKSLHGSFDGILLDVPCSNTGVFRRRVDARWRLTEESIVELRKIQLDILHNASSCLKSGGRIVYSTCSIDPSENADLIRAFLQANSDFTLAEERQFLPFEHKTDGAYAALLTKK